MRKTAEERAAGKSSEAGEDALSSHDNPQPVTSPTTAGDCHPPHAVSDIMTIIICLKVQ